MAAAFLHMVLRLQDRTAADMALRVSPGPADAAHGTRIATRLARLIESATGGTPRANLWLAIVDDTGAVSTGSVACTQANAAGDAMIFRFGPTSVAEVTLREGVDFVRGASNTTLAANLAAAINAHPVLQGLMIATPAAGTVNLVTILPGPTALAMSLATDDVTAFAITPFAGATAGVASLSLTQFSLGPNP